MNFCKLQVTSSVYRYAAYRVMDLVIAPIQRRFIFITSRCEVACQRPLWSLIGSGPPAQTHGYPIATFVDVGLRDLMVLTLLRRAHTSEVFNERDSFT